MNTPDHPFHPHRDRPIPTFDPGVPPDTSWWSDTDASDAYETSVGTAETSFDADDPSFDADEPSFDADEPSSEVANEWMADGSMGHDRPYAGIRRWLPAAAAVVVLAVVLVAALTGRTDGSAAGPSVTPSASPATTVAAATTVPAVVASTDATVAKSQLSSSLFSGASGDQVRTLQQRLTDLGFEPGPVDGFFGSSTQQAVWAFEKLVLRTPRSQATGVVTNEMWQTMQDDITIAPRRPEGPGSTHVEIYVPEQVMAVFSGDKAEFVTHVATGKQNPDGSAEKWCATLDIDTDVNGNKLPEPVTKSQCADAKTPGGIFRIKNMDLGDHVSPLGTMFNPVFFNYGIAIHGAMNVPLEPASHGCVRMSNFLAKTFPGLVHIGDRVYVWAQDGKEPEQYSQRDTLPSFNYDNPDATTTTTSTTAPPTTVPDTTVTPTTVKAPATTPAPPTSKAPVTVPPTAAPTTASPTTAPAETTTTLP